MMRPVILFGGIHDGLEFELEMDVVVLYEIHTLNPEDLFPTWSYPTIEEDVVTYANTYEKNKEGRWIFQII